MYWSLEPAWRFALLAVALACPIVFTLRLRRFALNAPGDDRTVVWFGFMRSLRWTLLSAVVLWWSATDFVQLQSYTKLISSFFWLGDTTAGEVVSLLLAWLPIFAVLIVCAVLSQPVYASVRGLHWTRGQLARLGILRLGVTYVPLLIIVAGGRAWTGDGGFQSYLCCFALASLLYLVSLRYLRAAIGWKPEAVSRGELRDRAFALAGKLGVKLRQVYIVPAGRMQVANAFASSSNTILLTDYLVTHLNRREVDAIVAHELGHLKHNHARSRGLLAGMALGGMIVYLSVVQTPFLPLLDIAAAVLWFLAFYFVSRRCEYSADAEGAKLTGDPEGLITGLAKTHSLNLMPVQWGKWGEKLLTHPSTVRRAQAIAKRAGLPAERVPEILQSALVPPSQVDDASTRYSLCETAQGGPRIFSTEVKRRAYWRGYAAMLAATAILPAVAVWAIHACGRTFQGWLICCGAILPAVTAGLILQNFLPFAACARLDRQLRRKAEEQGVYPKAWGGTFVGISPGAAPKIYEADYSWDMGYLFFTDNSLCYWGEQIQFSLRREQIVSVQLGPGVVGWLKAPSIYLTWRNRNKGEDQTFNLRATSVRSLLQMARANTDLLSRIDRWRSGGEGTQSAGANFRELLPPAFGNITGLTIGRPKLRPLLWQIVVVGLVAGFASSLFGFPVDFATPIARMTGLVAPETPAVWGWYSVLSAWLVALVWLVPFFIYRQPTRPNAPVHVLRQTSN